MNLKRQQSLDQELTESSLDESRFEVQVNGFVHYYPPK